MARVFLDSETYNAATDDSEILGSAGTEQVNVFSGVTGLDISNTVERVDLPGDIADFTFSSFGNSLTVYDSSGNAIASISEAGGKQVVFGDGALDVDFTGGVLTVGGEATSTDASAPAAITPAASEIDATTTSETANGGGGGGGAGQTFTLTTDADIISGTSGDDTVNGTNTTYDAGDVIVGGSGSDTLNIAASANNTQTATVTGVEAVNFNAQSFTDLVYNAAGVVGSGTTITFNNTQPSGATGGAVSNVTSGATVVAGSQVTGSFAVDLDSANGASVAVNAGSAGTITVTDVGSAGAEVTSAKVGTTATPVMITVDGDGDTSTAGTANDAATISAQGVVTLETAASDQVEMLTLGGNGQAATYNLDATGDAPEMVTFTGSQDVTLVGAAAQFATETATDSTTAGTTTLKINDGAAANLEKIGSDVIEIADEAAGAATYNVADNASLKLSTEDLTTGGALTLDSTVTTNTDTAETLNLEIDDLADSAANGIDVADFETVNLTVSDASSTTGDGTVTLSNLVGSVGTAAKINVTGSTNLTLTAVTSKEIDAATFTGNLTSTLSANMNNITTGTGADVFTAYDGNFTVSAGTGNDTLNVVDALDLSDNTISLTSVETINLNSDADVAAETTNVKSSFVDGTSYVVKGNEATNNDILDVVMDAATVDLSSLVVDSSSAAVSVTNTSVNGIAQTIQGSNGSDTLVSVGTGAVTMNGNAGIDSITTAGGADVIDGGAGADSLITAGGTDTVTGGEGADGISAGAGGDTINLTEAASAADNVVYTALSDGSAAGAAAGTFTGFDVITGFTSGTDDLVFDSNGNLDDTIDTDIVNGSVFVVAGTAATTASNDLTAADVTNVDKVAAFLSDGAYTTSGATQNDIVAVTFADFTAVYTVTDAVTGGAIAATEIALIGTVDQALVGVDIIA